MSAPRTWVIVPAAGRGARMGSERPKQYLSLAGMTVLERTLAGLLRAARPVAVVVALDPQDRDFSSLHLARDPQIHGVVGGASRAASVWAALEHIAPQARSNDLVLVHDAARPLVASRDVAAVLASLNAHPQAGAVLATPVADTVKKAAAQATMARVQQTLSRDGLWAAQTPQGARFGQLYQVMEQADLAHTTDEAMALEAAGVPVYLVPATAPNFKLTRPQDLALAEAWLRAQPQETI